MLTHALQPLLERLAGFGGLAVAPHHLTPTATSAAATLQREDQVRAREHADRRSGLQHREVLLRAGHQQVDGTL